MDPIDNLKSLEDQYWVALDEDWYDMAFKISLTALKDLHAGVEGGLIRDRVAETYMNTWSQRSKFCAEEAVENPSDSNFFDIEN